MAPPAAASTLAAAAAAPGSSRKRKGVEAADDQGQHELLPQSLQNEYELQRQQRIERNRQIMQQLGVDQAAAAVQASMKGNKRQRTAGSKKKVDRGCYCQGLLAARTHSSPTKQPTGSVTIYTSMHSSPISIFYPSCRWLLLVRLLPPPPAAALAGWQLSRP